ncbi:MAG: hypothetical protein AAFX99_15340 [Myxococcota bacterium]
MDEQRTQFDLAMESFLKDPLESFANVTLSHATGKVIFDGGIALLKEGWSILNPAIEAMIAQNKELYFASEARRRAEAVVEEYYERLYLTGTARHMNLRAQKDPSAATFGSSLRSATGGHTPSTFRDLNLKRSEEVMHTTLLFCTTFTPEGLMAEAQAAYDTFVAANKEVQREEGESTQAFQRLEQARTHAKQRYQSARKAIDAALSLDGLNVARYMPYISDIYRARPLIDPPLEPSEEKDTSPPDTDTPTGA